MENLPLYITGVICFILVVFNVLLQNSINNLKEACKYWKEQRMKDAEESRDICLNYQRKLAEENNLYKRAYHINKYWDKILREIYFRYGNKARLAPIKYNGMIDGIHNFEVKVNVPGSIPKPKQHKLGEMEEFNYNEMTFHQETFAFLIPEVTTEQEERFGKALYEMEVKFD